MKGYLIHFFVIISSLMLSKVLTDVPIRFCLYNYRCYFNNSLVTNTECSMVRDQNCSDTVNIKADLKEPDNLLWYEERVYYNIKIHRVYHNDWCGVWDGSSQPRQVPTGPLQEFPVNSDLHECSETSSIHVKDKKLDSLIKDAYPAKVEGGVYSFTFRFVSATGIPYVIIMFQGYSPMSDGSNGLVVEHDVLPTLIE